jgi:hypothetical protein
MFVGGGQLMSENNDRERKATLFYEHELAMRRRNELRDRAARIGGAFLSFGELMESQPESAFEVSKQESFGEVNLELFNPQQVELLQVENAFSVAGELRKTLRIISDLEHRMRDIGMAQ